MIIAILFIIARMINKVSIYLQLTMYEQVRKFFDNFIFIKKLNSNSLLRYQNKRNLVLRLVEVFIFKINTAFLSFEIVSLLYLLIL